MDKLGIGVVRRVGKYDVYIGVIGLSLLLGCDGLVCGGHREIFFSGG